MPTTCSFSITKWEAHPIDAPADGPEQSRVVLAKEFSGELVGRSSGEGLFCGMSDPSAGAGYVVSERIVGAIGERDGSFVIQHGGLMGPGHTPSTFGSIVPGSGTGDFAGISGTVVIAQSAQGHTMTLDYELGPAQT